MTPESEWPNVKMPNGADWQDSFWLNKKLADIRVRGVVAAKVRAEYARVWDHAGDDVAGRVAATAWVSKLTYNAAMALK